MFESPVEGPNGAGLHVKREHGNGSDATVSLPSRNSFKRNGHLPPLHPDEAIASGAPAAIRRHGKSCVREGKRFDLSWAAELIGSGRSGIAAMDEAIDWALASLESMGRTPEQARLELEIRHPSLAADIGTAAALRRLSRVEHSGTAPVRRTPTRPSRHAVEPAGETGVRYLLTREIGRGGRGTVYEAIATGSNEEARPLALKVLDTEQVDGAGVGPSDAPPELDIARSAAVRHPGVLSLEAVGRTKRGEPFWAGELASAGNLQSMLDAGSPAEPRVLVRLFRDAAEGLHAAHEHGVLHGNIKPANILLFGDLDQPETLTAKLGDFGPVPRLDLHDAGAGEAAGGVLDRSDAALHALRDTALFAAPERQGGQAPPTIRSDIYALGASMRYALGFGDAGGVDGRLVRLMQRAMQAAPGQRHAAASELAEDLDAWLTHRPIPDLDRPLERAALRWKRTPVTASCAAAAACLSFVGLAIGVGTLRSESIEGGVAIAKQELTSTMAAQMLGIKESSPLRDWMTLTLLYDRLRDNQYYSTVVGDRESPETRRAEVDRMLTSIAETSRGETLEANILRVEAALHRLRSPERHADTTDLLDRALAYLDPVLSAEDPLRTRIEVMRDVAVIKDWGLQGADPADAPRMQGHFDRVTAFLASRTDGFSEPLDMQDRRDPIVQLALHAAERLSHARYLDRPEIRAWCVGQFKEV